MSRLLLHADLLVLTDISDEYLTRLARQFGKFDTVQLACLDLNAVNVDDYRPLALDTVVCLNVLEHVEHDDRALRGIFDLLAPGGRLLLLVPAIPALYGKIDRALDHYRRYEHRGLRELLHTTGFEIEDLRYFNILGVPGWYFNARVLQRDAIPSLQTAFYDPVVPLARIEDYFRLPIGMSLIAIARKPEEHA